MQRKPARLREPRVEEIAHGERANADEAGADNAPDDLDDRALHAEDAAKREDARRHIAIRHRRHMAIMDTEDRVRGEPREAAPSSHPLLAPYRPLFRLDGDAKAEDDGAERGVCWH